jgi:hypothetical protein
MSEVILYCKRPQAVTIDNFTSTFYVLIVYVTMLSDHAIAPADILRSEAMLMFQKSLCKICSGQRGIRTVFSEYFVYPTVTLIPSVFHVHIHPRRS